MKERKQRKEVMKDRKTEERNCEEKNIKEHMKETKKSERSYEGKKHK